MRQLPIADVLELQQLLARYALGMTKDDVEAVMEVFTPDGTYSAFGDTYRLDGLPHAGGRRPQGTVPRRAPCPRARRGCRHRTTAAVLRRPDRPMTCASGTTPTPIVEPAGLASAHPVDDLPAQERRPDCGTTARPDPARPDGPLMEIGEFRSSLDDWLEQNLADLTARPRSTGDAGRPDGPAGQGQAAHL